MPAPSCRDRSCSANVECWALFHRELAGSEGEIHQQDRPRYAEGKGWERGGQGEEVVRRRISPVLASMRSLGKAFEQRSDFFPLLLLWASWGQLHQSSQPCQLLPLRLALLWASAGRSPPCPPGSFPHGSAALCCLWRSAGTVPRRTLPGGLCIAQSPRREALDLALLSFLPQMCSERVSSQGWAQSVQMKLPPVSRAGGLLMPKLCSFPGCHQQPFSALAGLFGSSWTCLVIPSVFKEMGTQSRVLHVSKHLSFVHEAPPDLGVQY